MILLVNVIIQVNIYTHTHIYIWIWTTQAHWCMDLSGECVISLVLSHHRKIWSNGQTSVIAQFHLESKGKYILEAWGWVDPKDKRGLQLNFGSSFYVFFLPPPLPPESALSESEVAQLCPTLSNPMDCSPRGSSVHGILQARVLEWGAIAFSIWRV